MNPRADSNGSVGLGRLDESDLQDANAISAMMETPGWKRLMDYYDVARESLIDIGKDSVRTVDGKDLAAQKWAILKGFDEFRAVPHRIVQRAEEYRERKIKEQEEDGNDE